MKRHFTLIELLIVISIIAILASMLLPALNQARARAQSARCTGRLKQIGTALTMYAGDYNDMLPPADKNTNVPGYPLNPYVWHEFLTNGNYLQANDILLCPSLEPASYSGARYQTYGYNTGYGGEHACAFLNLKRLKLVNVPESWVRFSPATFPLVADSSSPRSGTDPARIQCSTFFYPTYKYNQSSDWSRVHLRHAHRANLVFADGHVASFSKAELIGELKFKESGIWL
ncbi:MAG: prepilin-type N-terminal cleavage/methylation domain-containing protein [Lentisphaeria bacterium]|nr:prepilin-type N-terminal cleavage/methylation domain-containing protein [Lentisphaeria bacterium]